MENPWFSGQPAGVSPYNTSPARRSFDSADISPTSSSNLLGYFPSQPSQPRDVPNQRYRNSISLEVPQVPGFSTRGYSLSRQPSNHGNASAVPRHNDFTGPRSAPSSHGISRFQQDPEAPWIPRTALTNIDFHSGLSPVSHNQIYDFHTFREANNSDVLSDVGQPGPPDSAYVSQTAQSIYSAPVESSNLSEGIDPQLDHRLKLDDSSTVRSSVVGSDRRARRNSRASSHRRYSLKKCKYCKEEPKCESDYKKHMLKHEKTYYCDVKDCKRARQGFGTVNDLNRHKKSVHRLSSHGSVTKSYRCSARGCEKSDKVWPRFDNFKQHVFRVHKEEHNMDDKMVAEIVENSEIKMNQQRLQPQLAAQMPMQEALAGMELQPPLENPNAYSTVSPDSLMAWPNGMEPYRPSQEQGIYPNQFSPGLAQPEQLNKDGQTIHPMRVRSSLAEPGQTTRQTPGTKSPDQALHTLADVVVATAPTLTVTDTPSQSTDKEKDAKMDGSDGTASSSASQQGDTRKLNGLVEDSIGSNLQPSEKLVLLKALSALEDSVEPGKVLELLKKAHQDLETEGKKPTRSNSNMGLASSLLETGIPCPKCHKRLPRSCDMKKHLKRHTKPYGCTFPRCHKVFGSKNDWKRHENSQHFQQEMWRCQVTVTKHGTSDGKCGHVFYYANMFSHHLKNVHALGRERRDEMKQACRIGRSGHTRFWCGFCRDIIPVSGHRGQAAWDERFNHIDERHYKNRQRIDDWLCIETRATKGEQEGLKRQPILDESEPLDRNVPDDMSDEDGPAFGGGDAPPVVDSPSDTPPPEVLETGRAMPSGADQVPQFSHDRQGRIYCCQCGMGPFETFYDQCINGEGCDHVFCRNCYAASGLSTSR